jgi:hypothetical protein
MIAASKWELLVADLESQARTVRAGEGARVLKVRVEDVMSRAENDSASAEIVDRLDHLLIILTGGSRDVCTNAKCPHYNKKCRMR